MTEIPKRHNVQRLTLDLPVRLYNKLKAQAATPGSKDKMTDIVRKSLDAHFLSTDTGESSAVRVGFPGDAGIYPFDAFIEGASEVWVMGHTLSTLADEHRDLIERMAAEGTFFSLFMLNPGLGKSHPTYTDVRNFRYFGARIDSNVPPVTSFAAEVDKNASRLRNSAWSRQVEGRILVSTHDSQLSSGITIVDPQSERSRLSINMYEPGDVLRDPKRHLVMQTDNSSSPHTVSHYKETFLSKWQRSNPYS